MEKDIIETIRKEGNKWVLYSKDGTKKLGVFDSEEEAKERERQIIAAKMAKGKAKEADDAADTDDTLPAGVDVEANPDPTEPCIEAYRLIESQKNTRIAESARLEEASGGKGEEWDAIVIEEGTSLNGNHYGPTAVDQLFGAMEQFTDVNEDHPTEQEATDKPEGYVRRKIGFLEGKARNPGNLASKLVLVDDVLAKRMAKAWTRGNRNFYQLSINAEGDVERREADGKVVNFVTKIHKLHSVDLVTKGAAGGRMTRLVASDNRSNSTEDTPMKDWKTIEDLTQHDPALAEAIFSMPEEVAVRLLKAREAHDDLVAAVKAKFAETAQQEAEKADPEPEPKEEPKAETANTTEAYISAKISEALREHDAATALKTATADKDKPVAKMLTKFYETTKPKDSAEVERMQKIFGMAVRESQPASAGVVGTVQMSKDEQDKKGKALLGMLLGEAQDGVQPFWSLRQAYRECTGDVHGAEDPSVIMAESQGYVPKLDRGDPRYHHAQAQRAMNEAFRAAYNRSRGLTEAIISSTWAELLGDNIHRAMQKLWAEPVLDDWKNIVSNFGSANDFQTHRRGLLGGYGNLSTVNENQTYQDITSPGDTEVTGSLAKKGGLETMSIETIANDDVGAVKEIPRRLVYAAKQTLRTDVWNQLKNNATYTADSTSLGDAGSHVNYGTSALAVSTLDAGIVAMRSQAAYGWSTFTLGQGNMPKWLIVPNELRRTALQLVFDQKERDTGNNNENVFRRDGGGLGVIVVDDWTDADNWYLIADPRSANTFDVSYFRGKSEPELFTQDMPNVGSMFNADRVTWKIRFIYWVMALDYRSMYFAVV